MAYDPTQFNNTYGYYQQAAQNAMPSPESVDRAAARLRNRTDTQYNANAQRTTDQFANRGRANSGAHDYAQIMNNYGRQQAYSSGYAQILDDYEKNRMQGAANLGNIASQWGNTANNQGQLGIQDRAQTLSEEIEPRRTSVLEQEANTHGYQAQTQRAEATARALNDFLTFMGSFGNTQGGELFNRIFASGQLGFMNLLGMPTGTAEHPEFGSYSY